MHISVYAHTHANTHTLTQISNKSRNRKLLVREKNWSKHQLLLENQKGNKQQKMAEIPVMPTWSIRSIEPRGVKLFRDHQLRITTHS